MKYKSTLPTQPFFIHIIALLDLIIVLLVITMATSKINLTHGIDIQLPKSQFILSQTRNAHIINVSGGNTPIYYFQGQRYTYFSELELALNHLSEEMRAQRQNMKPLIILRLDSSVSREIEQNLIDAILSKEMNCAIATDAAL